MKFKSCHKAKRKLDLKGSWKGSKYQAEEAEKRRSLLLDEVIVKRPPGRSKWPCKRGKGEHKFQKTRDEECVLKSLGHIIELKCSVCGKKEIKFSKDKLEN